MERPSVCLHPLKYRREDMINMVAFCDFCDKDLGDITDRPFVRATDSPTVTKCNTQSRHNYYYDLQDSLVGWSPEQREMASRRGNLHVNEEPQEIVEEFNLPVVPEVGFLRQPIIAVAVAEEVVVMLEEAVAGPEEVVAMLEEAVAGPEEVVVMLEEAVAGPEEVVAMLEEAVAGPEEAAQAERVEVAAASAAVASTSGAGASVVSDGQSLKALDEVKSIALSERTGLTRDISNIRRKYGGMGPPPPLGSEVFVGCFPLGSYEYDLIPFFEPYGTIWDFRFMTDPLTGLNLGYAFITFTDIDAASKAAYQLDGMAMEGGVCLQVRTVIATNVLRVSNVSTSKEAVEIMIELSKNTAGLVNVMTCGSILQNYFYTFLEYDSQKAAFVAKTKLSAGRVEIFGGDVIVDWAAPQQERKIIRVSNFKDLNFTEEELLAAFNANGSVESVEIGETSAMVYFCDAEMASDALEKSVYFQGTQLELSFAETAHSSHNRRSIPVVEQDAARLQESPLEAVEGAAVAEAILILEFALANEASLEPSLQVVAEALVVVDGVPLARQEPDEQVLLDEVAKLNHSLA